MKKKLILFLLFFSGLAVSPIYPAVYTDADSGADFLTFGIGARPSGMGDAYVTATGDLFSSCWNPAGIAGIQGIQFGAMHSAVQTDASLEFLGLALPAAGGALSLTARFMLYDKITATDAAGNPVGDIIWQDRAASLTYARKIFNNLLAGAGLIFIQRFKDDPFFGETKGHVFAFNAGGIFRLPGIPELKFGASVTNLGPKIQMDNQPKEDLPRTIKIGASYLRGEFLFSAEFNKILLDRWRPGAGIEYTLMPGFFLRCGYYNRAGNLGGITYGLGVKSENFSVDWASLPAGEMLNSPRENRISLIFEF